MQKGANTIGVAVILIILMSTGFAYSQDATSNSITLTWTAPGDDGATGTAALYDLRYSLDSITDANWNLATAASGEDTPQPAGSAESFTVTGLESGTQYYFALKTADEANNWSELSNVVARSTLDEEAAPSVIADLEVTSLDDSSVVLTWTAPGDDGTTGTAAVYEVRYALVPLTEQNWDDGTLVSGVSAPQPVGSEESLTITGLTSGNIYYFAIKTADEVPNWSALSNVASAEIGDTIPPASIDDLTLIPYFRPDQSGRPGSDCPAALAVVWRRTEPV